ncbi:hypothetical protein [Nocardia sp. IFM 10818]
MRSPRRRMIRLSSIQVHRSESEAAFVAHSDQFPGVAHSDPYSSPAAVDGLLEVVERFGTVTGPAGPSIRG